MRRHDVDLPLWPERRTAEICRDWEAAGHAKAFRSTTGVPLATGFMAPSLEWIRRYEPDTLKRARYALLPKDYIRCILTESAASEPTDAAARAIGEIVPTPVAESGATTCPDPAARFFAPLSRATVRRHL